MEHRLITGGEQFLPFAQSCVRKLKRLGLPYANQSYEIDGVSIKVRIEPGHEYIRIEGGGSEYLVGAPDTTPTKSKLTVSGASVKETKLPNEVRRGPNEWRSGKEFLTWDSGRNSRYRYERAWNRTDPTTLDGMGAYIGAPLGDRGVWYGSSFIPSMFNVCSAALFSPDDKDQKKTLVAIELTTKNTSTMTGPIQERYHLLNAINVHAYIDGYWTVIGTYCAYGTTLKSRRSWWAVGYRILHSGITADYEMEACIEDPIHFSPDGRKFLVLVTPCRGDDDPAHGPLQSQEYLVSEVLIVEGVISAGSDGSMSVSFEARGKTQATISETVEWGNYSGLEMDGVGNWRDGSGWLWSAGSTGKTSISSVIGLDYDDAGNELVITQHYEYSDDRPQSPVWQPAAVTGAPILVYYFDTPSVRILSPGATRNVGFVAHRKTHSAIKVNGNVLFEVPEYHLSDAEVSGSCVEPKVTITYAGSNVWTGDQYGPNQTINTSLKNTYSGGTSTSSVRSREVLTNKTVSIKFLDARSMYAVAEIRTSVTINDSFSGIYTVATTPASWEYERHYARVGYVVLLDTREEVYAHSSTVSTDAVGESSSSDKKISVERVCYHNGKKVKSEEAKNADSVDNPGWRFYHSIPSIRMNGRGGASRKKDGAVVSLPAVYPDSFPGPPPWGQAPMSLPSAVWVLSGASVRDVKKKLLGPNHSDVKVDLPVVRILDKRREDADYVEHRVQPGDTL